MQFKLKTADFFLFPCMSTNNNTMKIIATHCNPTNRTGASTYSILNLELQKPFRKTKALTNLVVVKTRIIM